MYERSFIDRVKSFLTGAKQMAYLPMQFGYMIWCAPRAVLVMYNDGTWKEYQEAWDGEDYGVVEFEGLYIPQRGFGYVWHNNKAYMDALLGYAIVPEEIAYYGTCARTDNGWSFTLPSGERITLGDETSEDPPSYGYSNWIWLPTLDIPLNLFTVAFIGREDTGGGMIQFGHNIVLSLPEEDLEHILEVIKERI